MKKRILFVFFTLAVLLIAGFGINKRMNSYGNISSIALDNITALANSEDGSTKVKWCYVEQSFVGDRGVKLFCDNADNNEIRPCPAEDWGNFLEGSKDRCTTE